MKINIEVPAVTQCEVEECSYNVQQKCHAKAITIGDGDSPHCDTLFCGAPAVNGTSIQAGVGACKVSSCSYNEDLECSAESIRVGLLDDSVNCLTYAMR